VSDVGSPTPQRRTRGPCADPARVQPARAPLSQPSQRPRPQRSRPRCLRSRCPGACRGPSALFCRPVSFGEATHSNTNPAAGRERGDIVSHPSPPDSASWPNDSPSENCPTATENTPNASVGATSASRGSSCWKTRQLVSLFTEPVSSNPVSAWNRWAGHPFRDEPRTRTVVLDETSLPVEQEDGELETLFSWAAVGVDATLLPIPVTEGRCRSDVLGLGGSVRPLRYQAPGARGCGGVPCLGVGYSRFGLPGDGRWYAKRGRALSGVSKEPTGSVSRALPNPRLETRRPGPGRGIRVAVQSEPGRPLLISHRPVSPSPTSTGYVGRPKLPAIPPRVNDKRGDAGKHQRESRHCGR
jgi:hypothetical protein